MTRESIATLNAELLTANKIDFVKYTNHVCYSAITKNGKQSAVIVRSASELKCEYKRINGGHFFDSSTMLFFGDSMANYSCNGLIHEYKGRLCFELKRRRPVKNGLQSSTFFDVLTFESFN